MIEQILMEIKETWGYSTEELNDIREKLEEFGNSCFWEGYAERGEELEEKRVGFLYGQTYGKMEDNE